jgi:hypothetical protein
VEDDINVQTAYYLLEILEVIDALTEGDHFGDVEIEEKMVFGFRICFSWFRASCRL